MIYLICPILKILMIKVMLLISKKINGVELEEDLDKK